MQGSVDYANGIATFTNRATGDVVHLSQFGIGQHADGTYYIYAYDSETMNPPADSEYSSVYSAAYNFQLVASNQHPYSFWDPGDSMDCPAVLGTPLTSTTLYAGETNQGWMCTDALNPQDLSDTFTITYADDSILNPAVPVATLRIVGLPAQ